VNKVSEMLREKRTRRDGEVKDTKGRNCEGDKHIDDKNKEIYPTML